MTDLPASPPAAPSRPPIIASSLIELQNGRLAAHWSKPTIVRLGPTPWNAIPADADALFTYQSQWGPAPRVAPAGWPYRLALDPGRLRRPRHVPALVLRGAGRHARARRAGAGHGRICDRRDLRPRKAALGRPRHCAREMEASHSRRRGGQDGRYRWFRGDRGVGGAKRAGARDEGEGDHAGQAGGDWRGRGSAGAEGA